ncbi:MAG: cytochrome b/b6 domain-containing protein [Rhodocyclaceae bacterium]|nr:cytochrome b/b6 domain-containing protein [Rhodocyclaceae bacterium]
MRIKLSRLTTLTGVFATLGVLWGSPSVHGADAKEPLDNATCLTCHDVKKDKIKVPGAEGQRTLNAINADKYGKAVHARMQCVACHTEITDAVAPHRKGAAPKVAECSKCHEDLAKKMPAEGKSLTPGMESVVKNIAAYRNSFHARPNKEDKAHANATCNDCHDTHTFFVPAKDAAAYGQWRLDTPSLCGEKCHTDELDEYKESAHGKETQEKRNLKSAVCVDCHTTHAIGNTSANPIKLNITANCGGCHEENFKTYRATYHGQVGALGYAYTAKCFDCHGSHGILKSDDPQSKVHPDNRLKTCRQCHNDKKPGMYDATPGFLTFGPHANGHDFKKYPEMFIATKFMVGLLIFVFAFFWAHSGLWYYREWMDRKQGKPHARVDTRGLVLDEKKQHFERFHWGWRVAHLVFALVTMTLVLTGTSALFAQSSWAPLVAQALGGAKMLGLIHRVAAALFIGIFLIHFVYVMQKLLRSKTFRWFGPDSLIPNWKDFADCWGMFKWFLGKGPRPMFERWAYFEKFDYWAVFWGVNIIGWSGLMLAFPHVTAKYLPGWVFNVGTLVHGEEAFLAAVFLFTVHFFNNHFRPDKLPPPDVVMFTGTQSLEEFRHDHPAHYQRMLDTGELQKRLVAAPSPAMTRGSKVLGLVLIAVGLTLLVLVINGFLVSNGA